MKSQFAFDNRVARRYNMQRAHPPAVSRRIGEAIAAEAGNGAHLLEIGVGTGRIAHPTANAGCHLTGIDISAEMLAEAPNTLSLVQADMQKLPFRSQAFDGVLAVHVLHLTKNWQTVLQEAARVMRPGGALIQGEDWIDPRSVVGQLRDELRKQVLELAPNFRPPSAGISRQQWLTDLGAETTNETIAAEWTGYISPADRLRAVHNRTDAESWILPDDLFNSILDHLTAYVAENWTNPEQKQPVTRRFVLKVTRGNWQKNP